jgi:hypothetical protein
MFVERLLKTDDTRSHFRYGNAANAGAGQMWLIEILLLWTLASFIVSPFIGHLVAGISIAQTAHPRTYRIAALAHQN